MNDKNGEVRKTHALTAEDIQNLSESHRLGEVRSSGWWAYDRGGEDDRLVQGR